MRPMQLLPEEPMYQPYTVLSGHLVSDSRRQLGSY